VITSALLISGSILMTSFYFMQGSKGQSSLIKIIGRNFFLATSFGCASAANLYLVRRSELTEGINI